MAISTRCASYLGTSDSKRGDAGQQQLLVRHLRHAGGGVGRSDVDVPEHLAALAETSGPAHVGVEARDH
jgi:hypothetical protein